MTACTAISPSQVVAVLILVVLITAANSDGSDELLTHAVGAASWLRDDADCSATACCWPMNLTDDAPKQHPYISATLYYGAPGIALFLAQASEVQPQLRNLTEMALGSILEAMPQRDFGPNVGLYYGLAGVAFGLRTAGEGLPREAEYIAAALQLERHISAVAPFAPGASVMWNNTDVAHGAAGAGLHLLAAAEHSPPEHAAQLREAALHAGEWLLQVAEQAPGGGLRWYRGPDTDGTHNNAYFPTFCCGTAGIGYYLSVLARRQAEAFKAAALAAAAKQAAEHVLALAVAEDGTLLVPHEEEGAGLHMYYMGWCGGAAGWSRLFVAMWEQTGEQRWLEAVEAAARSVMKLALPQLAMFIPTPPGGMPWQNLGQCCGVASVGTFLLQLATTTLPVNATVKQQALAAAREFGDRLMGKAVRVVGSSSSSPAQRSTQLLKTPAGKQAGCKAVLGWRRFCCSCRPWRGISQAV